MDYKQKLAEAQQVCDGVSKEPWIATKHSWGWYLRSGGDQCKIAMERFDPATLPETHERQWRDAQLMEAARTALPKALEHITALQSALAQAFCDEGCDPDEAWDNVEDIGHSVWGDDD